MVAGEAILSCPNAKNRWFPPHTPLEGAAAALSVQPPPVGECCPLVGVPPSATTAGCKRQDY